MDSGGGDKLDGGFQIIEEGRIRVLTRLVTKMEVKRAVFSMVDFVR